MKNIKYLLLALFIFLATPGCKKFLNVEPIDALSGNNFWKSKTDVENFMNGIYYRLRDKVGGTQDFYNFNERSFFPMLEMRGNFINSNGFEGSQTVSNLVNNNMNAIYYGNGRFDYLAQQVMSWKVFYDIIAASNILILESDKVPSSSLSDTEKKQYKAQAVFMRNLSYLYICRLFGDAVYYTDAYHSKPLPRIDQVEVMDKCIADMAAYKNDLPVAYADASYKGFRPTQASADALMMHLNMWASAFTKNDKNVYYRNVLTLMADLDKYTAYKVLPITPANTKLIFKGNSVENLFGVLQSSNTGESFSRTAGYSFYFSHYPYAGNVTQTNSFLSYSSYNISLLFKPGQADNRKDIWFDNYDSGNGSFQFKKFANTFSTGSGSSSYVGSDDAAIIFRLPDAILLAAEAAAELDNDDLARSLANRITAAAGASPISIGGEFLKDLIFQERTKELIGEGQFYFDLVRTKKILNFKYTANAMSVSDYNAKAWTWPLYLSPEEKAANPFLVGNSFWN
ncbi:RagB/SusD family nutrient uptake outer membrane protein [Pedobacter changchengzhani]|uniref:RagB/SusD family nutrient uptake outer membrane protein n=1 Tax=Pedobacter changchengzhani TaxID=2529274 RepID=A0A4R5MKP0_9SPHI|nr:RagB/SusD family nutrient uptake outer membrane protein [Pedobacter changchengzhani]TDG36221.1 RagB/SusD family nutrient uptake outer membrane protein [Pedobacter changchengzhani]